MKTLDPQKLLAVLNAQQSALESLNYATQTRCSDGCCVVASAASEELNKSGLALCELEKSLEEP